MHLANDFSGSTVYKNLFQELDFLGFSQSIYTAVRSTEQFDRNRIDFKIDSSKILYRDILSNYTRINYNAKIKRVVSDVNKSLSLIDFDLIHAHTWYSDGGVAYELHKLYDIPYVITIRNTDLNLFFRYMLHLRSYGIKILLNAKSIIFISPVYRERFYRHPYIKNHLSILSSKSMVIPNGIDKFWLKQFGVQKHLDEHAVQILYIGKFTKGKNVEALIRAVEVVRAGGKNCVLNLIGKGGSQFDNVMKLCKARSSWITYHGEILEKEVLLNHYKQNHIFAMPSKNETFGLVYIEALTQGLPVLYTKGEGIDGLYDSHIGEAINASKIDSIAMGIENIISNYQKYRFSPEHIGENHNWSTIALKMQKVYS
ncbi:hypothetical protein N824_13625 [Pedobacter sp. V48]|nr:hypothetical protein N824_13625 [Pedobacter sp. V48]